MKVGVIGIGRWGTKIAREYIALMNEGVVDSVILCDTNESQLRQFNGSAELCNDFNEFIKKVDAVHICTPNNTHYEIAKETLENDIHVLIEKPMAESLTEAFKLVELALSKNLVLQVGHIFRFANIVREIRRMYLNNHFGKILYFNLAWTHLIPPMSGTDVIYDLLPHPLDILNFITEEWPIDFDGMGIKVRANTIEACYIQAIYESRKIANIHLSWINPIRRRYIEVVGTKKVLVGDCVTQEATVYDEKGGKKLDIKPNNTIREEILNFIKTIESGKNEPNSGIVGIRSIEMINKARKSIKEIGDIYKEF